MRRVPDSLDDGDFAELGLADVMPVMRRDVEGLALLARFAVRAGSDRSLLPLAEIARDLLIGLTSECSLVAQRVPALADDRAHLAYREEVHAALQAITAFRAPAHTTHMEEFAAALEAHARQVASAQVVLEARLGALADPGHPR